MNLNVLAFGDIVGKPGRLGLASVIADLKKKYKPDLILANGENLAHGVGITEQTINEILHLDVDAITTGNHVWDKKEGIQIVQQANSRVIRPYNYPVGTPGKGHVIIEKGAQKILIANAMGRVFMNEDLDDPFRGFDALEKEVGGFDQFAAVIVDLHAEATSEKIAFAHYIDGRATLLYGTHTHVPTADARIFPKGLGYLTDAGMTGARDSVIGVAKESVIERFLTQMPARFTMPEGPAEVSGLFAEIDPTTRKTVRIEQFTRLTK